jgi:hypothetical protein
VRYPPVAVVLEQAHQSFADARKQGGICIAAPVRSSLFDGRFARGEAMRRGRSVSIGFVVWIVIGVIVASNHQYLANLKTFGAVLSALLAILLWPLILLGTKITINI